MSHLHHTTRLAGRTALRAAVTQSGPANGVPIRAPWPAVMDAVTSAETGTIARMPIKVLVVDDHQMVAESIADALNLDARIEVVGVATSAAGGFECAVRLEPDIVVMDFNLGEDRSSGIDVIERIRVERPETQVIMITSSDSDDVLAQAIEAGCAGFVTKHRPIAEIADAIHTVNAGEAAISAAMLARLLPRLRTSTRTAAPKHTLSAREIEVLSALAAGQSVPQISERLFIGTKTVRNHIQRILMKMNVHSKLEAVSKGVREGIIDFPR